MKYILSILLFSSLFANSQPVVTATADNSTITLPYSRLWIRASATSSGHTITGITCVETAGGVAVVNTNITGNYWDFTITHLRQGSYTFRITATDNASATGYQDVSLTVNAQPAAGNGPVAMGLGEYACNMIDSNYKMWSITANGALAGAGSGTTSAIVPVATSFPDSVKPVFAGGSLHNHFAIDGNGEFWTWAENNNGQAGNGSSGSNLYTPYHVLTDSLGNYFGNCKKAMGFYVYNVAVGNIVLKNDGTLWGAGDLRYGTRGNGIIGPSIVNKYIQIAAPGGRFITDFTIGECLIISCSDGTAWSCGGGGYHLQNLGRGSSPDYTNWGQVTGLTGKTVTAVAGASAQYWALTSDNKVYGWGYNGSYLGYGTGGWGNNTPLNTATDLTSTLNLSANVAKIVCNTVTSYLLCTNGDLYAIGDNACGTVGNGQELNYATYATPYSWSIGAGEKLVQTPYKVLTGVADVWSCTAYTYYVYAKKTNGELYAWGRNKGAVIANGISACSSNQASTYPNAFDETSPLLVRPLSLSTSYLLPCPLCYGTPGATDCSGCTTPTVNAGSDQSITTNSTTLTATKTGTIYNESWTISGPGSPSISSPNAASTTVTGLTTGTYTATHYINRMATSDALIITVNLSGSTLTNRMKAVRRNRRQTVF